jgi:gag-polypeptide of LTR copia-type
LILSQKISSLSILPPLFIMSTQYKKISPRITINKPVHLDLPVSCKLHHNNFFSWRCQVIKIVNKLGLFGYLTGSIFVSSAWGTHNPNYLSWYMQDQLLLGWLRSLILVPVLARVIYCQTSATLWASIHELYNKGHLGSIVKLQKEMLNLQKGSQSCSILFEKMKSMANELAFLGAPVSDEDLMKCILCKLGPNFKPFEDFVTTHLNPPSLTNFHGLLLWYEATYISQSEALKASDNLDPVALHATNNNPGPRPPHQNSTQGHNGGQHTSQLSLVPTPSFVPPGTYPGPRGRGHGRFFPAQPPQQDPQPTFTPVSPQVQAVLAAPTSASNEGPIQDSEVMYLLGASSDSSPPYSGKYRLHAGN